MRKKLSLNTSLSASLMIFVLLFVAAAGAGIVVLRDNRERLEGLGAGSIERASDLSAMTSNLFQARAALTDAKTAMEGGLEAGRDEALAQAQVLLTAASVAAEKLAQNRDDSPAGAALFREVLTRYVAFADQALDEMHKAIKGWNGIEVNRLVEKVVPHAAAAYTKQADAYQAFARAQGHAALVDATRQLRQVSGVAVALLVFVLVLALFMRLGLRRAVLRPLDAAGAHFDRIADGDLTASIAVRGGNEIGVLYLAMRRMQTGLSQAVAAVRHGVEEIHTGAAEIAAGGADMSDRSAAQAASLQEASASMAQLADTVQLTAENAALANQQAASATTLARRGSQAVQDVISSMHGIADSARRIGEIVSVVDSIAFQTNILALNAAVEAARAGEQGRGFAVVAAEVRTLAQRSAHAAKEIKNLIEDSADRVQAGVQEVGRAGETINDMVQAIDRVTQIVVTISNASAEQASGIVSVNEAVADIDRATQENAAMTQQTAAAVQALASQAQALRGAVAVFQIVPEPADASWGDRLPQAVWPVTGPLKPA